MWVVGMIGSGRGGSSSAYTCTRYRVYPLMACGKASGRDERYSSS
jgi:hypothetical protein